MSCWPIRRRPAENALRQARRCTPRGSLAPLGDQPVCRRHGPGIWLQPIVHRKL
jgi:hypothetical protein